MEKGIVKLNRFTTLPILIDCLERKKLVLLDPASWDDKNDALIIEEYKNKAKIKTLCALCFTHESETIHHWKTFATGTSGCCIEFKAAELIEIFDATVGLRHGKIEYRKINEARPSTYEISEIPFIKRIPYQFEREYRIIWEGDLGLKYFELDVPLHLISRITFGQQMPPSVFESVKSMLIKNYSILNKKIFRSTIYENKTWIKNFRLV